jgi:hypothetical protein
MINVRRSNEMWPFKPLEAPKLTREEALKDLDSFIAELGAEWEHDGLDWAPALLSMLRDFRREAAAQIPDEARLAVLREQVHAYFKEHRFLKGIPHVLWDVDTICRRDT